MKGLKKGTIILFVLCASLLLSSTAALAASGDQMTAAENARSGIALITQDAGQPPADSSSAALNGWQKFGSNWYYYINGQSVKGVYQIGAKYYLFQNNGVWLGGSGWKKLYPYDDSAYWYYLKSDGSLATGWKKIGGKWYAFMSNETLPVGLTGMGSFTYASMLGKGTYSLYNMNKSGDKGTVYSFNASGAMVTGWFKNPYSGKTYYHDSNGKAVSGWKKIDGKWYFFSKYKFFRNAYGFKDWSGCAMAKGWKTIGGKKYYFSKSSGVMFTGKHKIGSHVYLFASSGELIRKIK